VCASKYAESQIDLEPIKPWQGAHNMAKTPPSRGKASYVIVVLLKPIRSFQIYRSAMGVGAIVVDLGFSNRLDSLEAVIVKHYLF
jgi:hypothetical protein